MKTFYRIAMLILIAGLACSALAESALVIPGQVTRIESEAFLNDTSLQAVIIPEGVTAIENLAFANSSVTSIVLPSTLQYVSDDAFSGCKDLSSVTIDADTLLSLNFEQLFEDTPWIHSSGKYENARWLLTVDGDLYLYGTGTAIGEGWQGNRNLIRSIYIGKDISIDRGLLASGNSLTAFYVDPENPYYTVKDQCLLSKDGTVLIAVPTGIDGAFTVPAGVQKIGDYAFQSAKITGVAIPDTVVEIGEFAFYGCHGLYEFRIGDNVRTVGRCAFSSCSNLTSLYIGASVQTLGSSIVSDSRFFESFVVSDANENFSSVDGVLLNGDRTQVLACPPNYTGIYTCPDTVASIEDGAFNSCQNLTGIVLPDKLLRIGKGAFNRCCALESIALPQGLLEIDEKAFLASGLVSVEIPASVKEIASFAFSSCEKLSSATFNEGLEKIGYSAFDNSPLTAVSIPASVKEIGRFAFFRTAAERYDVAEDNPYFSSVDGVLMANKENRTSLLYYPSGRTDSQYTIPDTVTFLEEDSFAYCPYLTSITMPTSVTGMRYFSIEYCDALQSITYKGSTSSFEQIVFEYPETSISGAPFEEFIEYIVSLTYFGF